MRKIGQVLGFLALLLSSVSSQAMQMATISPDWQTGEVVISQSQRKLYFVLGGGQAIEYPVAVAKRGKEWLGLAHIDGKYVNPAWSPPESVKRDHPELPDLIPGGSPHNPMGLRALTLDRDEIAIHGTNRPESIGKAASYGCIRMRNADVLDLFDRVLVGTQVTMIP